MATISAIQNWDPSSIGLSSYGPQPAYNSFGVSLIGPQPNVSTSSSGVGSNVVGTSDMGRVLGTSTLVSDAQKSGGLFTGGATGTGGYSINSPDNSSVSQNNILSKFPGYAGWDPDAAYQDYLKTGGVGKGGSSNQQQSTPQTNISLGGKTGSYNIGDRNSFQNLLNNLGIGANSDFSNYLGTPEQYLSEIDSSYNASNNLLNQAEAQAGTEKQSALDLAQQSYQASLGQLGSSRQSQLGTIAQNTTAAQQRKQSAQDEAARLYNEMIQGSRQRFGGGSSAGEAAQALLNQEQQRQIGTTQKDYSNVMSQLEQQKIDLENNYQSALQQLDVQKQQSLNDIMSSFNQRISSINQSRATSEENKAQARLAILQNLRSQALQLQQQQDVFKQNIQSMYLQQQMGLDTYAKQLAMSGQNTANAFQNLNKNITTPTLQYTTNAGTNAFNQPTSVSQSIGSINRTGNKAEDFLNKYNLSY